MKPIYFTGTPFNINIYIYIVFSINQHIIQIQCHLCKNYKVKNQENTTNRNHLKIVRHSAGALVAVDAYFEAPERVAALILVAPAILVPFSMRNVVKENQGGADNQNEGNNSDSDTSVNPFSRLGSILAKFSKFIGEAIVYMIKGMAVMINSVYKRALSAILRSAFGLTVVIYL